MKAQAQYTAAAGKVAALEAQIAEARDKAGEHVRLLEKVEALKAQGAAAGAATIAADMTLGDSSDWQQARKALYAAKNH
jgi:ribosomal 50S subunit-associated protein YjgA (DUF615 family)